MIFFSSRQTKDTLQLIPLTKETLDIWMETAAGSDRNWVKANDFLAAAGQILLFPDEKGTQKAALVGFDAAQALWEWGNVALALPPGRYCLPEKMDRKKAAQAALAWGLGQYVYDRYKQSTRQPRQLVWPKSVDKKYITAQIEAVFLARDLINCPANDMGPEELAAESRKLARRHKGQCSVISGDQLLQKNFPLIHAVGRASSRPPRLIDMRWGSYKAPKLTLVGKGVCFDSGGLDLKSSNNMLLMKKDMGGAAHVLALAHMIMTLKLNIRLRILIPAVENSLSGNAFRPMDILSSRLGKSVEIGNTDAEGRLVLADALALAAEEKPDLIIDFATLTGASRVALGTDVPSVFTSDEKFASALAVCSEEMQDPTWRMPLFKPYARQLDSKIADINSAPASGYGGAITAALFLQAFLPDSQNWAHIDLMAWNLSSRPGRPEGGEAQAIRSVFGVIEKRYR